MHYTLPDCFLGFRNHPAGEKAPESVGHGEHRQGKREELSVVSGFNGRFYVYYRRSVDGFDGADVQAVGLNFQDSHAVKPQRIRTIR